MKLSIILNAVQFLLFAVEEKRIKTDPSVHPKPFTIQVIEKNGDRKKKIEKFQADKR